MKKSYIILIIVSVLIILFITGYFISQNIYFDNGEIPEESGDEERCQEGKNLEIKYTVLIFTN